MINGRTAVAVLLVGAIALSVAAYNTWSLCCGHCTLRTFVTPGPVGLTLLLLTGAAALLLAVLRRRHRPPACRCGAALAGDWTFCPQCGEPAFRS